MQLAVLLDAADEAAEELAADDAAEDDTLAREDEASDEDASEDEDARLEAAALLATELLREEATLEAAEERADDALLATEALDDDARADDVAEDEARDVLEDALDAEAPRVAQKPGELMLLLAGMLWFQPIPVRLTVLPLCDQLAFQSWFTRLSGSVKLPLQPSMRRVPGLRTVISPQKPLLQSLVMR